MSNSGLSLFLSYSHKDEAFRSELAAHLAPLRHQGLILEWTDRQIPPGSEWEPEILGKLGQADIVILLISSDFINSKYCYGVELERALEKHHDKSARVVPVIARPCHWQGLPFGILQSLPSEGTPISTWPDRDSAYLSVAQGIENVARELLTNSSELADQWLTSLLLRRKVVREVQQWLSEAGFYRGPIDGEPANRHLREAVRRFQLNVKIAADGLIGPQVLRAIKASQCRGASARVSAQQGIQPDGSASGGPSG